MFSGRMNISKYYKLFVLTKNYGSVTIEANNATAFILAYLQATPELSTLIQSVLNAAIRLSTMSKTSEVPYEKTIVRNVKGTKRQLGQWGSDRSANPAKIVGKS